MYEVRTSCFGIVRERKSDAAPTEALAELVFSVLQHALAKHRPASARKP